MRGNAYLSGFIMHVLKLILEHSFWTPLTPLSHKMFASVVSCMLLMVQALNREDNFVKAEERHCNLFSFHTEKFT